MVKRIRPISRVIRVDAEVSRIKSYRVMKQTHPPAWDVHWIPRIDIYEREKEIISGLKVGDIIEGEISGKEIIVEAEIPGVNESDVEITVQSNRVEIKGRKRENFSSSKIRFLRLEREYGAFRRLVALPSTVIPDKARALLSNGVLKLCLKKYLVEEEKDG